jgi:hypothetical protein
MADTDEIVNKTAAVHLGRRELADPPPDSSVSTSSLVQRIDSNAVSQSEHSLGAAGDPEDELSTEQVSAHLRPSRALSFTNESMSQSRSRKSSISTPRTKSVVGSALPATLTGPELRPVLLPDHMSLLPRRQRQNFVKSLENLRT